MMRILSPGVVVAVALVLTSCFEYKGVITVSRDGSATLEELALKTAEMKGVPGGDRPGAPGNSLLVDKVGAAERAHSLGEGVSVKSHEEISLPNGSTGVRVIYAIADINKLKFHTGTAMKNPASNSKYTTLAFDGTNLTITNPAGEPERTGRKPTEEGRRAKIPVVKNIFAGAHFRLEVKAPDGIASTDATYATGDTITMFDVDFDELGKNDEHIMAFLECLESDAPSSQRADRLKGIDAAKFETKGTIKAVLK